MSLYSLNILIANPEIHTETIDTVQMVDDIAVVRENPMDIVHTATKIGMEDTSIRSIVDFLSRPESLKSIAVTTNTAAKTLINHFIIPQQILPIMKREKIVGFKNFRADCRLHIKCSSSPFISGKLLIAYFARNEYNLGKYGDLPSAKPSSSGYFDSSGNIISLTSITGCPHVILDLASGEPVDIVIPYVSHDSHWDMTTISPAEAETSTIPANLELIICAYTDIFVDTPFSLQLLVSLENVDLSFPTYPTRELAGARQRFTRELQDAGFDGDFVPSALLSGVARTTYSNHDSRRQYNLVNQGFISEVVAGLGSVAGAVSPHLDDHPKLGTAAKVVSTLATPISKVLAALGYTKNLHNSLPMPVEQILNRHAQNYDGVDTSRIFALSHANVLANDSSEISSSFDEMSFSHMFSRSEYIGIFNWSTSDPSGHLLFKTLVNPLVFDMDFVGEVVEQPTYNCASPYATTCVPTHLSFIGNMFNYWRGSIKYTFRFAKTAFHVGRVRILWLPGDQDPAYDPATTYDVNNPEASYFIQKIVDLRDTNEVEFVVPFAANRPFNQCGQYLLDAQSFPNYYSNGTILVQSLTTLSAPSTVSTTVPCVVEIQAGDDFEYAYYKCNPWWLPAIPLGTATSSSSESQSYKYYTDANSAPSHTLPSCDESYGGITKQCNAPVVVSVEGTVDTGLNIPLIGIYYLSVGETETYAIVTGNNSLPEQMSQPIVGGTEDVTGVLIATYMASGPFDLAPFFNAIETLNPENQCLSFQVTTSTFGAWGRPVLFPNTDYTPTTLPTTEYESLVVSNFNVPAQSHEKNHEGFLHTFWRIFQTVYPYAKDVVEEEEVVRRILKKTKDEYDLVNQSNITVDNTGDMIRDSNKTINLNPALTCMGEQISSIRALGNVFTRNTIVQNRNAPDEYEGSWRPNGFTIYPQTIRPTIGASAVSNPPALSTYLSQGMYGHASVALHTPDLIDTLALAFGFWKGSIRIKVVNVHGGASTVSVYTRPSYQLDPASYMSRVCPVVPLADDRMSLRKFFHQDDTVYVPDQIPYNVEFYTTFIGNDVEARDVQLQIPYYNNLIMSRVVQDPLFYEQSMYNSETALWKMPSNAYTFLYEGSSNGDPYSNRTNRFDVYRAMGSDFSFHFLQGLPPLALSAMSQPGVSGAANPLVEGDGRIVP
jgi:hypothetical protein